MSAYTPSAATITDLTNKHCALYTPAGVRVTTSQQIPVGVLSLRADAGYRFVGTPTIRWRYGGVTNQTGNFINMTANKDYCTFNILASTSYVYDLITVTTEEVPAAIPGTYVVPASMITANTTAHLKLYKSGVLATAGTTFLPTDTFTLTPDSGYKILSAGFQDPEFGGYLGFTIAGDGSTATFTNSTSEEIQGYSYSVESEVLPVGAYTFTQANLTATTAAQAKMYKGATLATANMVFLQTDEFKLVANAGRLFTQDEVYFRDGNSGGTEPFTVSEDRLTATYTNLYGALLTDYTVATVAAPVSQHTISQEDLDSFEGAHSDLTVNGSPAVLGTNLFPGDVMRAVAREGWTFYQNPLAPDGFVSIDFRYDNDGSFDYFAREGDNYAIGVYTVTNAGSFGNIEADTVATQPEGVKGFNNVYEVTDEQLKLITQSRWVSPPDGGEQIDYGKYILGLINLPFLINPDMVVTQQDVRLGPLDTDILANFLNSDTIRLPLGEIAVIGTKGNFLDYKDTVAMLHLPYCDSVALDLEYVIDQTVSIEYLISLYDGTAVVNISSSKTGDIVLTQNIDMNITIPFANINTYPARNGADSVKLGGDNGIRTAFIELLRNDAVLESGFFTIPIVDEKPLAGYTGFARIEEINLSSKATSYEKDLIVNQLNAGVIIK